METIGEYEWHRKGREERVITGPMAAVNLNQMIFFYFFLNAN